MKVLLVAFSWLFIVYLPHMTTSVHGEMFPPGYLMGDVTINCGCLSNSTALDGRYWVGETSFLRPKGKSTASTSANKLLAVDPTPYLTARISFSNFFYHFQLNPGQKFIRFHFYPESYQGFDNSQDLFTVKANSFTLLQNFSASLAAHALGVKYVVKEFLLNVNETGILQIAFFALQRKGMTSDTHAFVNGIEIVSMPTGLYYTPDDNLGAPIVIVGWKNRFHYLDNSTALELVQRLNVGGGSISPVDDAGMFRRWTEDVDYLLESVSQQISHLGPSIEHTNAPSFVAPTKIYQTSRKLRKHLQLEHHFTWKIPVDVGFAYLLRLHFCYFGVDILDGGGPEDFNILIQNLVAETHVDVIQLSGGKRIPAYIDYLVMMKGDKTEGKHDLCITLQSSDELFLGLLKGFEIFKLSNTDNSLASPNPSPAKRTSSFWTLEIQNILVAFGQVNVIMTALTILLAIVNSGVYQLRRICQYALWQERNVLSALEEPTCRQFSLTEILLATQDFNEALVIGKGGFGKVYKGFIYGLPEIVAIKRLKPESKQGAQEFWREIETLSKLRHMNLVSLLGYCMEREEMILVYEYMPRGTIADNLYRTRRDGKDGICLTWEQRLNICIGAARGLDYLHTGTQHGVIHRDVKDTNILLDQNFNSKISDFGLSKLGMLDKTQRQLSTNVKGTFGYIDPDYLMTHKPSTKSDVYAFGIVMLVVLSGRPAVERCFFGESRNLLSCFRECMKKGEMKDIIDPCLQEDILIESLRRFIDIVRNCLHQRPKKRPTMAHVVVYLEHALQEQIGTMPSTSGADSIVTGSNRLQVAPVPEKSMISLMGEGNKKNIGIQNVDLQPTPHVLRSNSFIVRECLLPWDYRLIIARSSKGPDFFKSFPSKKELYLYLCDNPILIDGDTKSFNLDKGTGKKIYMLAARDLYICWGDTPKYWRWTSLPKSRFSEVAELLLAWWLDISGKIKTNMLSPYTTYGAYLVFTTIEGLIGFEYPFAEGSVGTNGTTSKTTAICFDPDVAQKNGFGRRNKHSEFVPLLKEDLKKLKKDVINCPNERGDGWLEVELGQFFVKGEDEGELKMSLRECVSQKSGLIVQGIEIRPKHANSRIVV